MANPVDTVTIGKFTFIDNSSLDGTFKPDGTADFIQAGEGEKKSLIDPKTDLHPVYEFLQAEGFNMGRGGARIHPTKMADLRVAKGLLEKRAELLAPKISEERVGAIMGEFHRSKQSGMITGRFMERIQEQIVQQMPEEQREIYVQEQKVKITTESLRSIAKIFAQRDLTPEARKEAKQALVEVDNFINQQGLVLPEKVAQLHIALVAEYLSGYTPAPTPRRQVVASEPKPEAVPISYQYDRYVAVDTGKGRQGFDMVPDAAHILRGKGKIQPTQLAAVKRFLASKGIKVLKEDFESYTRAREAYQLRVKIDEAVKAGDYFGVKDAVAQLQTAYSDIAADKHVAKKEQWALQQLRRTSPQVLVNRLARHLERMTKSGDLARLDEEIRHFRAFVKTLSPSGRIQVDSLFSEVVQKVGKKCLGHALNQVADEVYANPSDVSKAREQLTKVKEFIGAYPDASDKTLTGWANHLEKKLPVATGPSPKGQVAAG